MLNFEQPHRRLNILTGEWILVSPHRAQRPWQGQVEKVHGADLPSYDPSCYLCPGNSRAQGVRNPGYDSTFVFTNDFSALLPQDQADDYDDEGLLRARSESGTCRVVCFSPQHNLTLPEMPQKDVRRVVDVWTREYEALGAQPHINYVQIFENKGAVMGCSNPHPHGQIWAQESVPGEPGKELRKSAEYFRSHHTCILCDYLALELNKKTRMVCENEGFAALVPFWAVWPFEMLVVPKRHRRSLSELSNEEKDAFAEILKRLTTRYDNLFEISFPYSSGIHQQPTNDRDEAHDVHMHMHFYPPLLRSATVKKFMVGYEMMADPQRDLTAEVSAARLRECSEVHYKQRA